MGGGGCGSGCGQWVWAVDLREDIYRGQRKREEEID